MEMMDQVRKFWFLQNKFVIGFLVIKLFQEKKTFLPGRYSKEILDLYENIKSKLDFAYQEVHSNNGLKKYEK